MLLAFICLVAIFDISSTLVLETSIFLSSMVGGEISRAWEGLLAVCVLLLMALFLNVSAVSARVVSTGRLRVRVLLESNRSLFPRGCSGSVGFSVVSGLLLVLVWVASRGVSSRRLPFLER